MTVEQIRLPMRRPALCILTLLAITNAAPAHDAPTIRQVKFSSPHAEIAGTLMLPHLAPSERVPCVVIVGGTLSNTRDGGMQRAGVPPRDALKRWADALVVRGYASLRYDKAGHGGSTTLSGWRGTYRDEAQVAAAAIRYARGVPEVSKVLVIGESAGAYLACIAAKEGTLAEGYLFLGGLCSPAEAMYAYNFGKLVDYVQQDPKRLAWAHEYKLQSALALGKHSSAMFAAAAAGKSSFELVDGDFRANVPLARRREELEMPPDRMFTHIKGPVLALAGEHDLNVPSEHAAKIIEIIREAGNDTPHNRSVVIAGADHSFQQAPADHELRFRERHSFESFKRPYHPQAFATALGWLQTHFPTSAKGSTRLPLESSAPIASPVVRAVQATEIDPLTATTPRRVQLAPGIEIVDDITDEKQTAGVNTLEGRIGPLLLAEGCQAHFIDMPAGMYVEEHPHSSESIIYTVRGSWVLCSKGRRHVMKPGTLFRFAANTPTGYEVPFAENAFILIFKGDRTTKVESEFIDYLKGMATRLMKEHAQGVPYLLSDLPEEHPARQFARERAQSK